MSKFFNHFNNPPSSNKNSSNELEQFWNDSFARIEHRSQLSEVELQESKLSINQFTMVEGTTLSKVLEFLIKSIDLSVTKSPSIVIICASAIRCVNLLKEIDSEIKKKCKIAKLFAKHLKINEQIRFLKKSSSVIAIGTPARLSKLQEESEDFANNISCLIVDCAFKDPNGRNIFQINETRRDLFALVHSSLMLQRKPDILLL